MPNSLTDVIDRLDGDVDKLDDLLKAERGKLHPVRDNKGVGTNAPGGNAPPVAHTNRGAGANAPGANAPPVAHNNRGAGANAPGGNAPPVAHNNRGAGANAPGALAPGGNAPPVAHNNRGAGANAPGGNAPGALAPGNNYPNAKLNLGNFLKPKYVAPDCITDKNAAAKRFLGEPMALYKTKAGQFCVYREGRKRKWFDKSGAERVLPKNALYDENTHTYSQAKKPNTRKVTNNGAAARNAANAAARNAATRNAATRNAANAAAMRRVANAANASARNAAARSAANAAAATRNNRFQRNFPNSNTRKAGRYNRINRERQAYQRSTPLKV